MHDFTDLQYDDFLGLITKIKECKTSFESLFNKYSKAKAELYSIEKKIREAEKNAESDYIQSLRLKKEGKEGEVTKLQEEIARLNIEIERKKEEIKAAKPDILLAALGVPKQEKWLWKYKDELGEWQALEENAPVSMNVWGFTQRTRL